MEAEIVRPPASRASTSTVKRAGNGFSLFFASAAWGVKTKRNFPSLSERVSARRTSVRPESPIHDHHQQNQGR